MWVGGMFRGVQLLQPLSSQSSMRSESSWASSMRYSSSSMRQRQVERSASTRASIIAFARSLTHTSGTSEMGPAWRGVSFRGELETELASKPETGSVGSELQQQTSASSHRMYDSFPPDDDLMADSSSTSGSDAEAPEEEHAGIAIATQQLDPSEIELV